ncbi:hypothetical protein [Streptomyces subrutilus]|uniref:Uncharacterized protein n=1 Tax=Streptomyces subrutilus TaxID=36818 RepID=A0A1E5NXL9_9ACTN|nr:hypothetical protein [Streptomyces subrutilus]OEJ21002.1 hypothetical protein BGK67_34465 [Streptomyces subrutilus]
MAQAQETAAEIKRLSDMDPEAFAATVVAYATGGTDRRTSRPVQGAALASPVLVSRTLDVLERASRETRTYLPRGEDESKKAYQARTGPFREQLRSAMPNLQAVVEGLAEDEADFLVQLDDEAFAEEWTTFVLDRSGYGRAVPRRVQGLAFRSLSVAPRAAALSRKMLEEPAAYLPAVAEEGRKARDARLEMFRSRAESEMRFLRYALQYAEARHGRMPSEPNVRLQALRLLGEAHPEELSQLMHRVRNGARAARDELRRERREARRAAAAEVQ